MAAATPIESADANRDAERAALFDFSAAHFRYEPYPIGLARGVLDAGFFAELVSGWPAKELFEFKAVLGNKYSLSEVNHPSHYRHFIRTEPSWRRLHAYVKSPAFLHHVIAMLYERHLDLGLGGQFLARARGALPMLDRLKLYRRTRRLSARFEFSMLPAAGGYIKPHTDSPDKLITLVVAMTGEHEWNPAHGGGLEIMRPRDITRNYNQMNRQLEFADMETLEVFPFEANQAVIFVKTFNSWHAVQPIRGAGSPTMRKTLTINIEAK